jgi:hypothetical protein
VPESFFLSPSCCPPIVSLLRIVAPALFSFLSPSSSHGSHQSYQFDGFPAAIVVDHMSSTSTVNPTFLNHHNVPRTVSCPDSAISLSNNSIVMVPTPRGWYQSTMPFHIDATPSRDADVQLGADWLRHSMCRNGLCCRQVCKYMGLQALM